MRLYSILSLLLLISLIAIFLPYPLKKGFNQFSIFLLLGLIFSLGGDTLLMFQDQPGFFVFGLSSFLVAHIFYTLAFFRTNRKNHEIPLIKRQGWVMVLIVAYGILFFREIKEDLGSMIGPVMLYTMAITVMLLLAANRFKKVSDGSYWWVLSGALLFVASDSILAWNKFVDQIDMSHTPDYVYVRPSSTFYCTRSYTSIRRW